MVTHALPTLGSLESKTRHAVLAALERATADCSNLYKKGKRSFELLGKINPDEVARHAPSFRRCSYILIQRLGR